MICVEIIMPAHGDITDRFELLIFETAEEYLEKKRIKLEELKKEAEIERREIEKKGVCSGCGKDEKLRWVRNYEFYSCYECFYHDLDCEASVMVPMHRTTEMKEYITEDEWEGLWEEENENV